MQPSILLIIGTSAVILGVEYLLWRLFRNKVDGLKFPHEADHSSLSFFTLWRLRMCAIVHTVFLLVCSVFAILILFPIQ